MFTGIIREVGTIQQVHKNDGLTMLTVIAPKTLEKKHNFGDSIAIDGACLSITQLTKETFSVEAIPETLKKTIIKNYSAGTKVNLESPVKVGDTLDGHMVQGHVDFVGTVKTTHTEGESLILAVTFPLDYARFFALKGSVTINGTSLTISFLESDYLEVSLIPETVKNTTLGSLKPGSEVNIEVDLIARYLDQLIQDKEKETKYSYLKERGFI